MKRSPVSRNPCRMRFAPSRSSKTLASFFLACLVVLGVLGPARTTHAQWAVFDAANVIQNTLTAFFSGEDSLKEFILDPLARMAAEQVRQAILRSVVTWANSGFEGSPAFVTNIEQNLRGLSDFVADSFTAELQASGVINSPFRDSLVAQLRDNYRRISSDQAFFETNRYTLDQYSDDPDAFLRGDFSRGGIRAWIHAWMNPQNNPLGAYGAARRELESRIANATLNRRDEINRNNGFLDFCVRTNPPAEGEAAGTTSLRPAVVGCRPGETVRTVGSMTHEQLSRVIGSDIEMIVSADELDELFGAVANGLLRRLFSEEGFAGSSNPSSGGGSSVDPNISSGTLIDAVEGQIGTLTTYRSNWLRIDSAIDAAQAACGSGGDAAMLAEVNAAAARSLEALTDVGNLLNELNAIKAKLSATGPIAAQDVREGAAEYQTLLASGRLPSVNDIIFATTQSQNAEGIDPPSLYMRMNEIAAERCR
jgi:hypothetical protein